jgi:hypothetical protein
MFFLVVGEAQIYFSHCWFFGPPNIRHFRKDFLKNQHSNKSKRMSFANGSFEEIDTYEQKLA